MSNSKTQRLNQLLAVTEAESPKVGAIIKNYLMFFKNSAGSFLGEKKTYEANEGSVDNPDNRYNKQVVTTVDEKWDWFINEMEGILTNQLSLESTNASRVATAPLCIGPVEMELSSLELLRLKSFFSSPKLEEMIRSIPVRSDTKEWLLTGEDQYLGRNVFQNPVVEYNERTTIKSPRILEDPNMIKAIQAGKELPNYTPVTVQDTTLVETGSGTLTKYSGEWSQRQKAECLKKLGEIKISITEALAVANQCEVVQTTAPCRELLNYLFSQ